MEERFPNRQKTLYVFASVKQTSIGLFHPIKYFVTASKIVAVNSLDGTGESCNIDTLRIISTPKWVISSPHTIFKKKEVQDTSK